jgi:hypothetical protein
MPTSRSLVFYAVLVAVLFFAAGLLMGLFAGVGACQP